VNVINPGDIKVNYIRILNGSGKFIDVSKIFVSLTIYEDIMSAFVTGSIILSDSIAINTLLPFLGEEVIEINYETPAHTGDEFKYTKTFHIYKIESIENFKQKNAIIELMFMSIDAFVDMNTKISQTFRGSVSDIAKKLLSKPRAIVHTQVIFGPLRKISFTSRARLTMIVRIQILCSLKTETGLPLYPWTHCTNKHP
jgi:predicted DNA-binding ArsR family transcriptional regulator